jgi:protein involved in polysaccharide export with SLBB domain
MKTLMRLACAALALALAGCAQTGARQNVPTPNLISAGSAASSMPAAFTFSPGDEFDLRVPDGPQYEQTIKVRPDGSVSLPLIGTLRVQGRTVEDLQSELRDRMNTLAGDRMRREYLLHPNDEIEIKFPFQAVLNEIVKLRPDGKIQLQMVGTVQAEGLSPEELQHNLMTRYARWLRKPDLAVIVRSVNSQSIRTADGLGRAGLRDLKPAIVVRSFSPPQVFVGGEVARPGTLSFRPGLSLVQAIVESGGQLASGDPSKLMILRRASDNSVEVVQSGFDADVLRSPDRDILLRPFDVVVLPKSGVATLADNLNQYVYNLAPFLRNSSIGATYNIRGLQGQ